MMRGDEAILQRALLNGVSKGRRCQECLTKSRSIAKETGLDMFVILSTFPVCYCLILDSEMF